LNNLIDVDDTEYLKCKEVRKETIIKNREPTPDYLARELAQISPFLEEEKE
jgi:hypothetical protein